MVSSNGKVIGRPSKMNPEIIDKISNAMSVGMTNQDIADLVDIGVDTLGEWRKDPIFSSAIKEAVSTRKLVRLNRIDAGTIGWQGSAWMMERCYPKEYCRPELKIAIIQEVTVNHNVNLVKESDMLRLMDVLKVVEAEALPEPDASTEDTLTTDEPNAL